MKNFFKFIIFIIIFIILYCFVFKILWIEKNPISYFYDEPKDSLDVIYIGGSNVHSHFNTVLAYNKYGFTTGCLSSSAQPFIAVQYLIKESEKRQTPNLYIIDISRVADSYSKIEEGAIRKVTDTMKFSKNKLDAINAHLNYSNIKKEDYINYYFSQFLYHDIWKQPWVISFNLGLDKSYYKGYKMSYDNLVRQKQIKSDYSNDIIELPEENKIVLQKLLNYIKKENLNVLFIVPKRLYKLEENKKINDAMSIIEENKYNVLNFNLVNDFDVDYSKDFLDFAHLNVYGATKFTLYFSDYLSKNYELPDHRKDKNYLSWEEEYNQLKVNFKKLSGKNFDSLLENNMNN